MLPKGFVKIRHYGLLANAQREARLALSGRLRLVALIAAAAAQPQAVSIEPAQPRCCRKCGGQRLVYGELEPVAPGSTRMAARRDSS